MVINHAKFAKESQIEDIDQYHCGWSDSTYKVEFHNHIVTGNLNILEDNDLINIFIIDFKYRVIPRLDIENI